MKPAHCGNEALGRAILRVIDKILVRFHWLIVKAVLSLQRPVRMAALGKLERPFGVASRRFGWARPVNEGRRPGLLRIVRCLPSTSDCEKHWRLWAGVKQSSREETAGYCDVVRRAMAIQASAGSARAGDVGHTCGVKRSLGSRKVSTARDYEDAARVQ